MSPFDPNAKLKELLQQGEGRYVEFKGPNVNLNKEKLAAPVITAVMSFASTAGDQESWIVVGIVEGKSLDHLTEEVLKRLDDARYCQLSTTHKIPRKDAPNRSTLESEWRARIAENALDCGGRKILVIEHSETLAGDLDGFMKHMDNCVSGSPGGFAIRFWRADYENTTPFPNPTSSPIPSALALRQRVTMIEVSRTNDSPRLLRARKDLDAKIQLGCGCYRFLASGLPIPPDLCDRFNDLWQMRQLLKLLSRGWKLIATLLVAASIAWLWISTANRVPPFIAKAAAGVDVRVVWQDFKERDLAAQMKRMNPNESAAQKLLYLNTVLTFLQKQLYRIGPLPIGSPDPGTDGGDGALFVTLQRASADAWRVRGQGHIREFEKSQQGNNEIWGIALFTDPLARTTLQPDQEIQIKGELTSPLQKAPPIPILFNVRLDSARLWRASSDDKAHFDGSDDKTRIFVDTSTLPGIALPGETSKEDRLVHIGTLVWDVRHLGNGTQR